VQRNFETMSSELREQISWQKIMCWSFYRNNVTREFRWWQHRLLILATGPLYYLDLLSQLLSQSNSPFTWLSIQLSVPSTTHPSVHISIYPMHPSIYPFPIRMFQTFNYRRCDNQMIIIRHERVKSCFYMVSFAARSGISVIWWKNRVCGICTIEREHREWTKGNEEEGQSVVEADGKMDEMKTGDRSAYYIGDLVGMLY